jgi:nitrate reductase (NAD(P)H)
VAGEDATEEFMAIHSSDAKKQLADFHIGTLVGVRTPKIDQGEGDGSGPFLSQTKWKNVELVDVEAVSSNTKVYRFALQRPDQELGLPIGQHVYVRLRRKTRGNGDVVEGELVQRAYTPISKQDRRGFIDLLIKCVAVISSALASKIDVHRTHSLLVGYIIPVLDSLSVAA